GGAPPGQQGAGESHRDEACVPGEARRAGQDLPPGGRPLAERKTRFHALSLAPTCGQGPRFCSKSGPTGRPVAGSARAIQTARAEMPAAPDDAERFVRCLLALPDLQLRVDWLNTTVQTE